MTDLRHWLENIGLGQYADLFSKKDTDREVLASLDEQDLEKLGVSLGHRKKLLKAIPEYCGSAAPGRRDEVEQLNATAAIKPERRHLTILFCDLVGSTSLSAQLDPEDLRQILLEFQRSCTNAIRLFDGHIARFLGDGVLAYFGFPASREGDAERAVSAALKILESVSALDGVQRLEVRIGIASGVVVAGDLIGDGSAAEFALVGEAPNLAARLQALAGPNQILVSAATRKLLGRIFELADLGEHNVRGLEQSTRVWRVLGHGAAATRFEALQAAHLTPLIGREPELALLRDKCAKAEAGHGQLILISGEAGIGKSRLVMELTQRLVHPYALISLQCSSYHTSSAWHPIIRYLERAAGITHDAAPDAKLQKLQTVVRELIGEADELIPLFAALLSIPAEGRSAPLDLTPQQQKSRTFAALLDLFKAQSRKQPVLLIFEDVHWIDPTSLELLERLRDCVQSWPMCVIVLSRPELTLPWTEHPQVTALTINRLDREQVAAMAKLLSTDSDLPGAITDQIVTKSDGVPLFVEEMTKAVLDYQKTSEAQLLSDFRSRITVPDTLHESLMARLDQVAPMKAVAQIAAVIGREFSLELVQAVAQLSKDDIRSALDRLLASGLLFRSGRPADQTYTFKHALVQDEAYASLLRDDRRRLHLRTAAALCGGLAEIGDAAPELVAHHYTQAGDVKAAIDYWIKAGRRASERYAFSEASTHFQMALKIVAGLPASPQRDQ